MQTGKPPDQMVLDNNDEVWYDEAEEIDEAVELEGLEFPLRIGKNLQGMSRRLQAVRSVLQNTSEVSAAFSAHLSIRLQDSWKRLCLNWSLRDRLR